MSAKYKKSATLLRFTCGILTTACFTIISNAQESESGPSLNLSNTSSQTEKSEEEEETDLELDFSDLEVSQDDETAPETPPLGKAKEEKEDSSLFDSEEVDQDLKSEPAQEEESEAEPEPAEEKKEAESKTKSEESTEAEKTAKAKEEKEDSSLFDSEEVDQVLKSEPAQEEESEAAKENKEAEAKSEESTESEKTAKAKDSDKAEAEQSTDEEVKETDAKEEVVVKEVKPAATLKLTSNLVRLKNSVRNTLRVYNRRMLNTGEHNHWEIMHQIVAWGPSTRVRIGSPNGKPTNAIIWQSWNRPAKGMPFIRLRGEDLIVARGPRVQGHDAQFLAILAQGRISLDSPLYVQGKNFTMADLLESEKRTCRSGEELTFKLISFAHYLNDTDEVWKNDIGEDWDLEKILREELASDIYRNAACGGTHRMMGFSYALQARKRDNKPLDGDYARAEKFVDEFHKYSLALQNPDGSFSTEWFRSRQASSDLDRRLQTTGHILEWLTYSLEGEEVYQPKMLKAVSYLNRLMATNPDKEWSIGPLGHAIHALKLYDERVFAPAEKAARLELANKAKANKR